MRIQEALEAISEGALDTTLNVNEFHGQQKKVAEAVNHIRQGLMSSVNERLKHEKLKADLITNVSHDIKTPLTSIVNYVDLLKRENLENENAKYYIHAVSYTHLDVYKRQIQMCLQTVLTERRLLSVRFLTE